MKLCPKCGINYIEDTEQICSCCKQSTNNFTQNRPQTHAPRGGVYFDETFLFTNETIYYRNHYGFKAFNSKGENVGLVFSTDDCRTPAYGNLELCIFEKFWNKYGEWHRITSHGCRIPWKKLCRILSENFSYKCYID